MGLLLPDGHVFFDGNPGPHDMVLTGNTFGRIVRSTIITQVMHNFQNALFAYVANHHIDMTTQLDHAFELTVGRTRGGKAWHLTFADPTVHGFGENHGPTWNDLLYLINGISEMLLTTDCRMLSHYAATFSTSTQYVINAVQGRFGFW